MITPLIEPFDRIERQKAELLAQVAALDTTAQRTATSPRVWAPLQIVHHLILVEREYLHFIETGKAQNVASKRPTRSPMRGILLWVMRKRLSVPTLPAMEPTPEMRPLPELVAEWDSVRATFRSHLEAVTAPDHARPIALNPMLGPMNAPQILEIMEVHQEYHLAQVPSR